MPSLAELRKKIKGISSTRQITKAMKMVAGARFARAARQMNDALYYEAELGKLLFRFFRSLPAGHAAVRSLCIARRGANSGAAHAGEKPGSWSSQPTRGCAAISTTAFCAKLTVICKKNGDRVAVLVAVGRKAAEHYRNS